MGRPCDDNRAAHRFGAILESLVGDDAPSPAVMLAAVRWRVRQLGVSVEDCEREMTEYQLQEGVDPRPPAVLSYRVAIAKQLELTELVLSTLLE